MIEHVLCDFDGTLVDSSAGILSTLRNCIAREGLSYRVEPSNRLIGPPLRSMICEVVDADSMTIDRLETEFRREYDEVGYQLTSAYPGISQALHSMKAQGVGLHIVSNKRRTPLMQILETEGWSKLFLTVNTLDTTPEARTKTDVVRVVLRAQSISTGTVIVVGDSLDDRLAAECNQIPFAWASWGYGRDDSLRGAGRSLADANDLVQFVFSDNAT